MTEDRATRASRAPQAPQGPAPAPGADPAPGRAPQGDTGAMTVMSPTDRPPSTSMATPKPRIVVWESDICSGVITGWSCADCEDEDCEHDCHQDEPAGDLRERLAAALRKAAYVCPGDECPHDEDTCGANEPILLAASAVIDGIPDAMLIDGEVTAIADAVLPLVEEVLAERARTLRAVEIDRDQWRDRATHCPPRAEVSDDPTAATYIGFLQRAENAEDRLRKAERRVEHFEEHAAQINADLGIETHRAEQAERQRDQAIAALTHHAAEAHRRKWAHQFDNRAAFDALHALAEEILASRDRLIAAIKPKETHD